MASGIFKHSYKTKTRESLPIAIYNAGALSLKIDDNKLIIEKGMVTLDGRPSLVLL